MARDVDNELVDIGQTLAESTEELRRVRRLAFVLTGVPEPDWPAMVALVNRLDRIIGELEQLPGAELARSIKGARENLDYWADRADAASY